VEEERKNAFVLLKRIQNEEITSPFITNSYYILNFL
jgi:hypothetical protein